MTTNLSKHSMKSMGCVKWDEALVVVTVSIGQSLLVLGPKPMVMIRPCGGLVRLKGFKDSRVRVNVYHLILKHDF